MSDYHYPGPRAQHQHQHPHNASQPQRSSQSQPIPCPSYSTSMPPTASYVPDYTHTGGIAGYTSEQLRAAGYTPEQLHAAGYGVGNGVAPNVMAPAALLYTPANMPQYQQQHQQQQQSMQQQLHALNRLQEGASNHSHNHNHHPYQQQAPAYSQQQQQASIPAYQQYLEAQSLLASLSRGQAQGQAHQAQGQRRSQAEEVAAHHKWIGLSSPGPGAGSTLAAAAATASQQSFPGLSPAAAASHQQWFGQGQSGLATGLRHEPQQSPKKKPARERKLPVGTHAQESDHPPMKHAPDPSLEDGLPTAHQLSVSRARDDTSGSPSMEEQLQSEFEYTRIPSVPRRKDYAQMDAERPKLMGVSKIFVRSKVRTQKGLDRRERKNASARANAATKRTLVEGLSAREREQMTPEEIDLIEKSETARERKNRRSHESHTEKKNEIDRILSRTPEQRTPIEMKFLEQELSAKRRKNEGDRLRRLRLKELGYAPSRNTGKIGVPARGPIPPKDPKYPGASGASVSTATSTASATAAPAAARSDEYSIATRQSPTNEGTMLTYGYQ
jgi:hypothetical protein